MALLHFDGFEWIGTGGAHAALEYLFSSGDIQSDTGRLFGQSANGETAVFDLRSFGLKTVLFTGFGFKLNASPSTNKSMSWTSGGVEQVRWEFIDNAGAGFFIRFLRGATTLGTSPSFGYGQWHYFEIKITVDPTTGDIELRRNEVPQLTLSGINTANTGVAGADSFRYTWNATSGNPRWDDWYILDTAGTENNNFLGDSAIEGITVTANGATIQWTPLQGSNFQNVDDGNGGPTHGNDVNQSDTVGQIDVLVATDLVFTTGTIFGLRIEVELAMAAAGSRNVGVRFRDSGGTSAGGGNFAVSTTSFRNFVHIFERNPVTAAVWTNASVNGGQYGYEVLP